MAESRIQHILDKAYHDGYTRRVNGLDTLAAFGGVAEQARPDDWDAAEGTMAAGLALQSMRPARVVAGARLDPCLVAASPTPSVVTEQYRALRTRILQSDSSSPLRVLMVTSPGAGEGKSLTAGNLGLAMAQDQAQRICLVDGDLRTPSLARLFGLPDGPGLSDVLAGGATLPEALVLLEEHQLVILPAGRPQPNQAELLGSVAMRRLVATLRAQYDRVVVDCPPVAPFADVGILTPLTDALLLVVRARITSKPAIREALSSLDQSRLLGLVLNESP